MPTFIARSHRSRWGLLLTASDLDHAKSVYKDETGIDALHVEPFDGPLAFEFSIPASFETTPESASVEALVGPSPLDITRMPFFAISQGLQGEEMRLAALAFAFPATRKLHDAWTNDTTRPRASPDTHPGLCGSVDDLDAMTRAFTEDLTADPPGPPIEYRHPEDKELDELHEAHLNTQTRELLLCEQLRIHVQEENAPRALATARELIASIAGEPPPASDPQPIATPPHRH